MSTPETSTIPAARRIITYHTSSGTCTAKEDTAPLYPAVGGLLHAARGFVQSDFPAKPERTAEYAETNIEGFIHSKGLAAFFVDFRPGLVGPMHFSNSMDYIIVTEGELELETTEGQKWRVRPGELVVNAANIHYWHNPSDKWTRMFCVAAPCEPVKTAEGKTLAELYPDAYAIETKQ